MFRSLFSKFGMITGICAALVIVPTESLSAGNQSVVEDENRKLVRNAFEGWEAGTFNVFDLLHDEVVWTITGFDPKVSGTYHGKEDLLSRTIEPFSKRMGEGLSPILHEVWADGDHVLVRFDGEGQTAAGDIYKNQYLWIFTLEEGAVTEVTAFLDTAAFAALLSRDPGTSSVGQSDE